MTASLAGYLASAGAPLYSAAKHGIVGLMRALKNDLATVGIAISVVAPGITVTPILSQERKDIKADGIDEWAAGMQKLGVPINKAETIALANERNEIDILRRRMDASVLLIKGLGGGWDVSKLPQVSSMR